MSIYWALKVRFIELLEPLVKNLVQKG